MNPDVWPRSEAVLKVIAASTDPVSTGEAAAKS
jgi:hypothetical protein